MRLAIFAQHVATIMTEPVGSRFTVSPCEGVKIKVEIYEEFSVYVNDKWVGSRHGAKDEFIKLVSMAQPSIELDHMTVKVHVLSTEETDVIRHVLIPVAEIDGGNILDVVFKYGQNDFAIGPEKNGTCSVSVGDVIEAPDGRLMIVRPVGFAQMNPLEFAAYVKLPREDRVFSQYSRSEV